MFIQKNQKPTHDIYKDLDQKPENCYLLDWKINHD